MMNELKLTNFDQGDITTWDFEQLRDELSNALSVYDNMVYTAENIKAAKDDKSTLNKAKKIIEDKRKAYKAKCLEPYDVIEPKIKGLVSMIEEKKVRLDTVVKDYTERQKLEKEAEVKEYYDKKAHVLGEHAAALYNTIKDTKWFNATTSKSKYQEEVQIAINKASADINEIKALNSAFYETLIEVYISSGSVEKVKEKDQELTLATNKAGIEQASGNADRQIVSEPTVVADASDGVSMKIFASKSQLDQICDFMKAIGVRFEMQ